MKLTISGPQVTLALASLASLGLVGAAPYYVQQLPYSLTHLYQPVLYLVPVTAINCTQFPALNHCTHHDQSLAPGSARSLSPSQSNTLNPSSMTTIFDQDTNTTVNVTKETKAVVEEVFEVAESAPALSPAATVVEVNEEDIGEFLDLRLTEI